MRRKNSESVRVVMKINEKIKVGEENLRIRDIIYEIESDITIDGKNG